MTSGGAGAVAPSSPRVGAGTASVPPCGSGNGPHGRGAARPSIADAVGRRLGPGRHTAGHLPGGHPGPAVAPGARRTSQRCRQGAGPGGRLLRGGPPASCQARDLAVRRRRGVTGLACQETQGWGSSCPDHRRPGDPLHPEGATSGRFHLRQPRRPRSPHATALRFRCPAPRRPDKCAGLAERMSLDGPNGGSGPDADRGRFGRGPDGTGGTRLGTSAPRPPSERGALPRTGRSTVITPRRAFRPLRWSGERHGDHEIAECVVAVTGDRPRSLALPTTRKG